MPPVTVDCMAFSTTLPDLREEFTELADKNPAVRRALIGAFLALLSLNAVLVYWGGQFLFSNITDKFASIDNRLDVMLTRIEDVKQLYTSKVDLAATMADLNKDRQRNISSINDHFTRIDTFLNTLDEKLDRLDDKYEDQIRDIYMRQLGTTPQPQRQPAR